MWSLVEVLSFGVLSWGMWSFGVCAPPDPEKRAVRILLEWFLVVVIILFMSVDINYKINKISVTDEYCRCRIILIMQNILFDPISLPLFVYSVILYAHFWFDNTMCIRSCMDFFSFFYEGDLDCPGQSTSRLPTVYSF